MIDRFFPSALSANTLRWRVTQSVSFHGVLATGILFTLVTTALAQQQRPPPKPPPSQPQLEPEKPTRTPAEVFLAGRVFMVDGSALPNYVKVKLQCDGTPNRVGSVTTEGSFSLALGGRPEATFLDASVSGSDRDIFGRGGSSGSGLSARLSSTGTIGQVNLAGCTLEAESPGYQSTVLSLGMRSALDGTSVGDLFLQQTGKATGTTVSATTLAAPKKAIKAFDKARKEFGKRKYDKAIREAEKALELYPKYALAWQLLGDTRNLQGDSLGALQAFDAARVSDPFYLPPLVSAARVHVREGRFTDAVALTGQAIEANALFHEAYYVHALGQYNLGNLKAALSSIEHYMAGADQKTPAAFLLHGFILARESRYAEAAEALERFAAEAPAGPAVEQARQQLASWEQAGLVGASSQLPP